MSTSESWYHYIVKYSYEGETIQFWEGEEDYEAITDYSHDTCFSSEKKSNFTKMWRINNNVKLLSGKYVQADGFVCKQQSMKQNITKRKATELVQTNKKKHTNKQNNNIINTQTNKKKATNTQTPSIEITNELTMERANE